jgi:zinc transport system substrate-binding protein
MKKIINIVIVLGMCLLLLSGCKSNKSNSLVIVTTNFVGYDFARAVVGDEDVEIKMLLKPGMDAHQYEPTPKDIKSISDADIFIYVGGESEEWVSDILEDLDSDETKVIKMMDSVNLKEEEVKEGMEEEEEGEEEETEYDEHVWTSPKNAILIVSSIEDKLSSIDEDNEEVYEENAENYISKLNKIDEEIREVVSNSKRKVLIFGDRFPLIYFVDEYGLDYYAAFPGCSADTEASAKTISFLIDKVKKEKVPAVLKIELSSGKIADTIASETGVSVKTFYAVHNVSAEEFKDGKTYIDYMNDNIKVLREVLN